MQDNASFGFNGRSNTLKQLGQDIQDAIAAAEFAANELSVPDPRYHWSLQIHIADKALDSNVLNRPNDKESKP